MRRRKRIDMSEAVSPPLAQKNDLLLSTDEDVKQYLALLALHNSIPKGRTFVQKCFVEDYLRLYKYFSVRLAKDLRAFLVPTSAISFDTCDADMFAAKVSALVMYIQMQLPKAEERTIGYRLERQ